MTPDHSAHPKAPAARRPPRDRISTTMLLVLLFILLAVASQWISHTTFRQLYRDGVHKSETEKIDAVSRVMHKMLRLQGEHVQQTAKLLSHSRLLPSYATQSAPRAANDPKLFSAAAIAGLDVLQVTDEKGTVIYSPQAPDKLGKTSDLWGVSEALTGLSTLTSGTSPEALTIYAIEPLQGEWHITGALIAGIRLDEGFIQTLSRDVGADLVLLSRTGQQIASQREMLDAIDKTAVVDAFFQKVPIYRTDEARHETYVYVPVLIVDDAAVILVRLDSSPAYGFLAQATRRSATHALLFVLGSALLGIACLRYILRPLRRLRVVAEKASQELGGPARFNDSRDEVAAVAHVFEELTTQLLLRNRDLTRANARLRELDIMKSDFVSSVSHELRTPLTSVWGFSKLIRRDFTKLLSQEAAMLPPANREKLITRIDYNLSIIGTESKRLTDMIGEVLDLAKIEMGDVAWQDEVLDPAEVCRKAIDTCQGLLEQAPDVRLTLVAAPDLPPVLADPHRLQQVLLNLISNALKFTPEGSVEVSVEREEDKVRICVRDSGIGIPEKDLEMIFTSFYQATMGNRLENKPHGTGLGLSICRSILAHYGSWISVTSEVGRGSVFCFELPAHRAETTPDGD